MAAKADHAGISLIRGLLGLGCVNWRQGAVHNSNPNRNPANGIQAPVPRHGENKIELGQMIRQQLGLIQS